MIKLNKIEDWIDTKLVIKDFTDNELNIILSKLYSLNIKNAKSSSLGNDYIYVRSHMITFGESSNVFYKHEFKHLKKKDIFMNIQTKLK